MVECRFCCTKSSNVKEPRLTPQLFSLYRVRAPHALRLLYIRSPSSYAYAELNAHGARHARPLSFARMEVLRTSQEEQIELSLSLDFFRFAQRKRATAYAAALLDLMITITALIHQHLLFQHSLFIEIFLVHFFCCENRIARLN